MFRTMKIAHRLGLGFALALCFAVALAGAGIGSLASVMGQFEVVSREILPKTDLANQNIQAAYDYARAFAYIVTSDGRPDQDAASIEKARGILVETVKLVNANTVTLTGLLTTADEKAMLAKVVERRAAYGKSRNQVLALGKDGHPDEAAKVMFSETNGLQTLYIQAIKDLIAYEGDLTKRGVHAAEETSARARMGLILMLVAMTVVGTLTSIALTRTLLSTLGGEPRDAVTIARKIAAGDLTVAVVTRAQDNGSLMFALKTMRDGLSALVGQVRGGTDQIATASSEIATGSLDLSSRTEQQASALQQTAASMEELASTVQQTASNAKQANDLAIAATAVATKGGQAVGEVIHTMTAINESSKKIADITAVIDGIAFQTNILALNAAVEAARAGEQGRGFAVVAGEVRILAQRSAAAAKDIKSLISASVERADHGTALVEQAGATMAQIVTAIARVTEVVSEISRASSDQSAGVAQIGEAVNQLDQATQQNAALVEESSAAAASLSQQAQQMVHAVAAFKT